MGLTETPLLCLDSDALLYRIPYFDRRSGVDLATCRRSGPQYTWFGSLRVLERLCASIQRSFADPDTFAALDLYYANKISPLRFHGGNVCDMHLLGLFSLEMGARYRDLENAGDDRGIRYDNNLSDLDGFEGERGVAGPKQIIWRDGLPHGRRAGELVTLGGLHFQGGLKRRMIEFLTVRRRPCETARVVLRRACRTAKGIARERMR